MANWSYYDSNGDKITVSGKELKALAEQGIILPGTVIESPDGKTAPAKRVKGLLFATTESIPSKPTISESAQPVVTENNEQPEPLTEPNADTAKTDDLTLTTLHAAVHANNPIAVIRLLKTGADVHGKSGMALATPLHIAASMNATTIVQILIDAGADVNMKNMYGWAPLGIATNNKFPEVADILKKAGATLEKGGALHSGGWMNRMLKNETFGLILPFVVLLIYGILAAFGGYAVYEDNISPYYASEVSIVAWLIFGVICCVSGVLIIGSIILGVYYYVSRKADSLYGWCAMVAFVPLLVLSVVLVIGLVIAVFLSPLFLVVVLVAPIIVALIAWGMEITHPNKK